jgi:hypothetical protein
MPKKGKKVRADYDNFSLRRFSRWLESSRGIFLGGPYIENLRGNEALTTALSAVTAAVVGVVLNLAVWFGLHVIFPGKGMINWFTIVVASATFIGMVRWKWISYPLCLVRVLRVRSSGYSLAFHIKLGRGVWREYSATKGGKRAVKKIDFASSWSRFWRLAHLFR